MVQEVSVPAKRKNRMCFMIFILLFYWWIIIVRNIIAIKMIATMVKKIMLYMFFCRMFIFWLICFSYIECIKIFFIGWFIYFFSCNSGITVGRNWWLLKNFSICLKIWSSFKDAFVSSFNDCSSEGVNVLEIGNVAELSVAELLIIFCFFMFVCLIMI